MKGEEDCRGGGCINFNFVFNSRFTFCVCPHTRLYIPRVNHFHRLLERLFSFIFLPSPRPSRVTHFSAHLIATREKRLHGEGTSDNCL